MPTWPSVPLEKLAHVQGGLQVTRARDGYPLSVPYLRVANVHRNALDLSEVKNIQVTPAEVQRTALAPGDLLMVEGHGNRDEVGRCAIWNAPITPCTHQNHLIRVRCESDRLLPRFACRVINSHLVRRQLGRRANTTSGLSTISTSDVRELELPLPPLEEQRRIADILDRADALRAKRRAALALLDELTQSIFLDMFGDHPQSPVTIGESLLPHPRGWEWVLLRDVARLATGHTPDRKQPAYWNGDVPWLSLSEIRAADGELLHDTAEHISPAGLDNSAAVRLPAETVCFSRTASVGFVTVLGREMATSQDFVNWVCGSQLDPIYLMHAFMRSRQRLRSLSTGSTHRTIYFPTVERFRVLLPPLALQRRFRDRVEAVRGMRATYRGAGALADALFASLQDRAFRGEL